MRIWGTIGEIDYERAGWSIYQLAYEYRLKAWWGEKTVYADNFSDLQKMALDWQGEETTDMQDDTL